MIANSEDKGTLSRTLGRLTIAVGLAATAGIILSAAAAPVRLLGVTRQGDSVLIEATEPVAYSVSRPDAQSLIVDMRNVSVADARADVERQGAIAGVRIEQVAASDGRAMARVHVALAKQSEYVVRSSRNTIRVEPKAANTASTVTAAPKAAPSAAPAPAPVKATPVALAIPAAAPRATPPAAGPAPVVPTPTAAPTPAPPAVKVAAPQAPVAEKRAVESIEKKPAGAVDAATLIERIKSSKAAGATTVTLVGNGRLAPSGVSESKDRPRRLVLDFLNVESKTPTQTSIDSALVSRVRVGLNSHQPLVTRVVMEIANTASYQVQRSGDGGRDLAIVFEQARPSNTVTMAPLEPVEAVSNPIEPEAPVTLQQAMANVAAITKPDPAGQLLDPMSVLKSAPATPPAARETAAPAAREATTPAPREAAAPAAREVAAPAVREPAAPARTSAPPARQPAKPNAGVVLVPQTAPPPQTAARQQPATLPAAQQQGQRSDQPRQYTGDPLSLDLDGVDLRAVLRTFADVSGLNMVIDPDVNGTVDIKLTDVPWDQALDVILRGNQLDYSVDGTIVRISKIKTLEDENRARQAAAQAASERQAQAGGLSFETFPLSYAKAAEMAPLLKGSLRLSKYGQVQIDARTNTLIIADLPEQFPAIRDLLTTLDRAEPQVEIEARIITTTRDFARAIGIQWGLNGRMTPELGNTTNLAFPNQGAVNGRLGDSGTAVNLPAQVPGTPASLAIGIALGAINGAFNLDVALSALERSGKGRVLSTPRVTTQNNVEAEITQGVQLPLVTPSTPNAPATVTYKDAALTMRVTPQITAANTVIMQILVDNSTPGVPVEGGITIDTQRAATKVQVIDGATTVLGGIFIAQERSTADRTPMLYRLPLLGWLFKRDTQTDESRELLIFITPRILKG